MSPDLQRCLLDAGYTPPRDALPGLLTELTRLDETSALKLERTLARAGIALIEPVRRALAAEPEAGRLRLLALLGRLASTPGNDKAGLFELLSATLADESLRCRRAAVFALGKLGDARAEAPLLALLPAAPVELARSLAEALGKVGGGPALAALHALNSSDADLSRRSARARALLARRQTRREPAELVLDRPLPQPTRIGVSCRRGLERVLADELAEFAVAAVSPALVELDYAGSLKELLVARTALGVAIAVTLDGSISDPRERLLSALTRESTLASLRAWTRGVPRFRFDFDDAGHQRALAWAVAESLTEADAPLINDPRQANWTATVPSGTQGVLWLAPKLDPDPRFGYRKRDVPAASHPSIAAALARLSEPTPADVVWDPFMGSGLELIERARLAPYRRLIGSDLDRRAIAAAHENFAAAGVSAETLLGDALELLPSNVNVILTNPPMGRRVARDGSLRKLLENFVAHAARVLAPGGKLLWLSPLDQRTQRAAERAGLLVEAGPEVDMGGFSARVQLLRRR